MGPTCCEARAGVLQGAASSAGPSGSPAKNLDDLDDFGDIGYPVMRGSCQTNCNIIWMIFDFIS